MKTTIITCDFCGTKGATSIKKDARYATLEAINARGRNVYIDAEKAVPSVTITYAKQIAGGGIGEIDLCGKCRSSIEIAVESIIIDLVQKKNKSKAFSTGLSSERIANKKSDRASNK